MCVIHSIYQENGYNVRRFFQLPLMHYNLGIYNRVSLLIVVNSILKFALRLVTMIYLDLTPATNEVKVKIKIECPDKLISTGFKKEYSLLLEQKLRRSNREYASDYRLGYYPQLGQTLLYLPSEISRNPAIERSLNIQLQERVRSSKTRKTYNYYHHPHYPHHHHHYHHCHHQKHQDHH